MHKKKEGHPSKYNEISVIEDILKNKILTENNTNNDIQQTKQQE